MRYRRDEYLTVSHCAQSFGGLLQLGRSVHVDAADPLHEGVNVEEGGEGLTQRRENQSQTAAGEQPRHRLLSTGQLRVLRSIMTFPLKHFLHYKISVKNGISVQ